MAQERLQKILAQRGVASRRKCEQLIEDGFVKINGETVNTLPVFVDPEKDEIMVNGKRIKPADKVYFLLNKPKNVICTNSDPRGRKKAIDFVNCPERIFCVGRLDSETSGLIILTNDSELTNRMTHPRYHLPKKYVVQIKGKITGEAVEKIKKGVWFKEGKTGKAGVKILKRGPRESLLEITLTQGINRQIRRTLARVGMPVKSLKRVKIGKIGLKGVGTGQYRKLTPKEISYLKQAVSLED